MGHTGMGWVMEGWGWVGHKIITHRVSKFTNGYEGMYMSRGKFLKP